MMIESDKIKLSWLDLHQETTIKFILPFADEPDLESINVTFIDGKLNDWSGVTYKEKHNADYERVVKRFLEIINSEEWKDVIHTLKTYVKSGAR